MATQQSIPQSLESSHFSSITPIPTRFAPTITQSEIVLR